MNLALGGSSFLELLPFFMPEKTAGIAAAIAKPLRNGI